MAGDNCLPLMSAASRPREVFVVQCSQKEVLGTKVDIRSLVGA